MSTNVLPALPLLEYPVTRTSIWKTRTQQNVSGKEVRIADWSSPRYRWELSYSGLRETAAASLEFSQLMGFFDTMKGGWDSFLYLDPNDNYVAAQSIGTGDGVTTVFPMLRSLGGAVVPILATTGTVRVYLNGVSQSYPSLWNFSSWGASTPGMITFVTAPGAGVAVTADINYYWPCRFDTDEMSFGLFMQNLYEAKKVVFTSIK